MEEKVEETQTPGEAPALPTSDNGTQKTEQIWEVRAATFGVLIVFLLFVVSIVASIFVSIYQGVAANPKVWRAPLQAQGTGVVMKPRNVRNCVRNLQALDQEQHRQSQSLWFQMRHGHRGHLTLWQEWSRSWRKRMHQLQKQCPMTPSQAASGAKKASLPLNKCVAGYQTLSTKLRKKSDALWRKVRHGRKDDLRRWKDWSRDWSRRMQVLVDRCPLYQKGDIAKSFRRASQTMLTLQARQEKAMLKFFGSSADLFRDVRQAMHSLKEELR